ncbi:MAG: hypothetical protein R3F11_17900 [Verrucomicrobiales bacterium]
MKISTSRMTHGALWVSLLLLLMLQISWAESIELRDLRKKWQDANSAEMNEVEGKYLKVLKELQESLTKANRLEDALAVQAQVKLFSDEVSRDLSEKAKPVAGPPELLRLQSIYENEIKVIEEKNGRIYFESLKSLQKKFAKSGNLEEAVAVKRR